MLNSDMVLIKDVFDGSTKDKGEPTCTYAECPDSPTLSIAEEYAADNALFVKEFTAAYIKMLTKGNDFCDLEVVPSKGSGAEIEQLYGVTAIKQGCGVSALSPEAVGPTTSGPFAPTESCLLIRLWLCMHAYVGCVVLLKEAVGCWC